MLTQEKINQLALQVGGETSVAIVQFLLDNGKNISEFLIAEKLDVEIKVIRKTLYLLQEVNLVSSMRKKDKKKGWYIYYWTFDKNQAKITISKLRRERINNLRKRLEMETESNYYTCSKKCIRMNFGRAMENNFTCPECDKILDEVDNSKQISTIRKELELLEIPEEAKKAEAAA